MRCNGLSKYGIPQISELESWTVHMDRVCHLVPTQQLDPSLRADCLDRNGWNIAADVKVLTKNIQHDQPQYAKFTMVSNVKARDAEDGMGQFGCPMTGPAPPGTWELGFHPVSRIPTG